MTKFSSDVRLLLVGDGPHKDTLKTLVEQRQLENRVIFAGMVAPQKIADYYAAGDVFFSASQSETQGLTYIEAMASSLPLFCKKDTCLDSVVKCGENGFVYNNSDEFIKYENTLYSDFNLRKCIGVQASTDVRGRYSSELFAQSAVVVYNKILSSSTQLMGGRLLLIHSLK